MRIDTRTKRRSACFLVPKRFVGVVVVVKQGGGFGFLEHDDLDFESGDTDSDGGEDETPAETGKETGDVSDPTEEKETETEPDEPDENDENDENDPDTAATPTTAFPKTKTIKWEYESEVTDRQKKAAAVARRLKPGKGKKRVFFHAGDVEGQNVTLREGDEVEFGVTLPSANSLNSNPKASGGRKGDGPSGGGGQGPASAADRAHQGKPGARASHVHEHVQNRFRKRPDGRPAHRYQLHERPDGCEDGLHAGRHEGLPNGQGQGFSGSRFRGCFAIETGCGAVPCGRRGARFDFAGGGRGIGPGRGGGRVIGTRVALGLRVQGFESSGGWGRSEGN